MNELYEMNEIMDINYESEGLYRHTVILFFAIFQPARAVVPFFVNYSR
jgi:hypothetical protein